MVDYGRGDLVVVGGGGGEWVEWGDEERGGRDVRGSYFEGIWEEDGYG